MAATVTGAFVVLDRASRPIRRIRDEAIQADVAVSKLGASLDKIGTSQQRNMLHDTAQQIRSLAGESHEASVETEQLAKRMEQAGSPQMARNLNTNASGIRNVRTASRDAHRDVDRLGTGLERVEVKAKGATQKLSLFGGALNGLRGGAMAALIPMIGLLAQGIGALGAGVIELLPNLQSFGALAAPLATGITGIGLAAITAKLAFKDLGKAMSTSGQAHEKALAKLTPQARSFVHVLQQYKPLMADLRKSAQAGLFPGLETAIRRLAAAAPMANQVLRGMGQRVGSLAANAAGQLTSKGALRDFQIIADQGMHAVTQLGRGVLNLVQVFRNFMVVGAPFTHWMMDTIYGFTESAKKASILGRETGSMARFFDRARDSLTTMGHIARNVFEFLRGVLHAATHQSDLLYGSIEKTTDRWAKWSQSAHGQHDMRNYFAQMQAPLHAIVGFIGALGKGLGTLSVGGGFSDAMTALSAAIPSLTSALGTLAGGLGVQLVQMLGQVVQMISTLVGGAGGGGPLLEMLKTLNGVLKSINGLVQAVPGLGRVLATAFTIVAVSRFAGAIGDLARKWMGVAGAANSATAAQERALGAGAVAGGVGGVGGVGPAFIGGGLGGGRGRGPMPGTTSVGAAGPIVSQGPAQMALFGPGSAASGTVGRYGTPAATQVEGAQSARGLGRFSGLGVTATVGALAARKALPGMLRAGLGTAGRFAWPIAAFQGLTGVAGTQGTLEERLQGGLSSLSFGAIHAPVTSAQAKAAGMTAAQAAVARNSTATTLGGMGAQLNNLRRAQSVAQANTHPLNQGGGALGDLGRAELGVFGVHPGGKTVTEAEAKKNVAAVKVYNDAITRMQRAQHDQSVTEATRAGERMAIGLGQAFNVYSRANGIHTAMRETTRDTVAQISHMGPVGGRAVAQNMLMWAREQARANPKLWGQVRSLENKLEGEFDHLGRHIEIVNGQILDGSKRQWEATGKAISDPMEQALERTSRYFTQLQEIAAGQLRMMGFSQSEANGIIRGSESITQMTGGKVSGAAALGAAQGLGASGARYAAQGAATKKGATGMRIPGVGLSDHVPINGIAAPGELIVNRHTERKMDNMLRLFGTSTGSLVAGETKPHSEPMYAFGGRNEARANQGASGLQPGVNAAAQRVLSQFPGLAITSTTGGGHAANSYHYRGMAVDLGGSAAVMNRAAAWIGRTMGGSLTEGIHNPNLSIKGGQRVPASFWGPAVWGEHANHIHLAVAGALGALQGLGGGASATGGGMGSISLPRQGRGKGVAGAMASAAQNAVAAGMEQRINAAIGGGTDTGGYSGGGDLNSWLSQALRVTGHFSPSNLAGLRTMAMGESGGNPNIRQQIRDVNSTNGSGGAMGLMQTVPATFNAYKLPGHDNIFNPVDNAIASIRYQYSRYGRIVGHAGYSHGGRVPGWGGWHASGGSGRLSRPTLLGAGETPGVPEDVTITPHRPIAGQGSTTAKGATVQLHFHPGSFVVQGGSREAGEAIVQDVMDRLATVLDGMGMESEGATA